MSQIGSTSARLRTDRKSSSFHKQAIGLMRDGRFAQALKVFDKITKRNPADVRFLFEAGGCALQAQEPARAIAYYEKAAELEPSSAEILNNLGSARLHVGEHAGAIHALQEALKLKPEYTNAWVNLASAQQAAGLFDAAEKSLRQALVTCGADKNLKQTIESGLSDLQKLSSGGQEARSDKLFHEAERLFEGGQKGRPVELLRQSVTANSGNYQSRTLLDHIFRQNVPSWHFAMLNDARRNDAYDNAIRAVVREGDIVLDIGTGSGLLAMMAVRAGAAHVYACEGVELIADKASQIVAANGFQDTITVIGKWSRELVVGQDLPEPADVLISEIIGSVLLSEGLIPALEHAYANLLKPDARVLPSSGAIHAMPVECRDLHSLERASQASGFDVSLFNEFARYGPLCVRHAPGDVRPLGPSQEIFRFDFTAKNFAPDTQSLSFELTENGVCHGVVAWVDLQVDTENVINDRPDLSGNHWLPGFYLIDHPREHKAGDVIKMTASHDTADVHFVFDQDG